MEHSLDSARLTYLLQTITSKNDLQDYLKTNNNFRHFSIFKIFENNNIKALVYGRDAKLFVVINCVIPSTLYTEKSFAKYWYSQKGKVNNYFQDTLDLIWDELFIYISKHCTAKKIILSGYAIGAGIATICAARLYTLLIHNPIELYTFGSPKVGDKHWAENFKINCYRFVLSNDYFVNIPIYFYKHVGNEKYFNYAGELSNSTFIQKSKDKLNNIINKDYNTSMYNYLLKVEKNNELLHSS